MAVKVAFCNCISFLRKGVQKIGHFHVHMCLFSFTYTFVWHVYEQMCTNRCTCLRHMYTRAYTSTLFNATVGTGLFPPLPLLSSHCFQTSTSLFGSKGSTINTFYQCILLFSFTQAIALIFARPPLLLSTILLEMTITDSVHQLTFVFPPLV